MRKPNLILLLIIFLIVTSLRYKIVVAGFTSLMGYLFLVVSSQEVPWRVSLLEYWIASLAWTSAGIWLTVQSIREIAAVKTEPERPKTAKGDYRIVLFALGLTIIAPPIVAPLPPNLQGELASTRLLPPLSGGTIYENAGLFNSDVSPGSGLLSLYVSANTYLLHRVGRLSGNQNVTEGQTSEGTSRVVFLFGTDDNGRDVFSRVVYGARTSIGIGLLATLGAMLIGGFAGFVSGLLGRRVDTIIMRTTDLFLAIPGIFLVIAMVAFLGQSATTLIIALAVSGWMATARVIRSEVQVLRGSEFVLVARMLGEGKTAIILRHLIPNLLPLIAASAILQLGSAVLAEAALGFLGIGIQPPTATWGNMMGESMSYLRTAWWVGLFPGLFLSVTIVTMHFAGDRWK